MQHFYTTFCFTWKLLQFAPAGTFFTFCSITFFCMKAGSSFFHHIAEWMRSMISNADPQHTRKAFSYLMCFSFFFCLSEWLVLSVLLCCIIMIGGSAPRGESLPKFSVNNLNYTGLYENPFTKSKPFLRSHDGDTFF